VRVSHWSDVFAGPYGLIYDYSIERESLMRAVGRAVWGIDMSVLYTSMEVIGRVTDGATILDVPCGGGVAFRALRPDQGTCATSRRTYPRRCWLALGDAPRSDR
jgi:hypothetical protein